MDQHGALHPDLHAFVGIDQCRHELVAGTNYDSARQLDRPDSDSAQCSEHNAPLLVEAGWIFVAGISAVLRSLYALSITGARGSYTMELDHYAEVPALIATKIVQKAVEEGRVRVAEEE